MKAEYRIFLGVALFLLLMAIIYPIWTYNDPTIGHVEWIGTVALVLSLLLCAMCGGYFWFVSRRIDPRPEDRLDAEIADGAGELGFFSPGSYWPFGIAVCVTTAAAGLAFDQWWLVGTGIAGVLFTACALIFEYYTGTRRSAEH